VAALKELSLKDYCRLLEISILPRQGIGGCPAKGGGEGGKCGSHGVVKAVVVDVDCRYVVNWRPRSAFRLSDSTSSAGATLFEAIDVLEKEADVRGQVCMKYRHYFRVVEWQMYEAVCPS
jgi:hypothetical protein